MTSARPTLENLKKKPSALVFLTTATDDVPNLSEDGWDFDWFNNAEAASDAFDDMVAYTRKDIEEHGDSITFAMVEVLDTEKLTFGRFDVQPSNAKNKKWLAELEKDPKHLVVFPDLEEAMKEAQKAEAKKRVRAPRKKSDAAGSVTKITDAPTKKAATKKVAVKKAAPTKATEAPAAKKAAPRVVAPKKAAPVKATGEGAEQAHEKAARLRERLAANKVAPATT